MIYMDKAILERRLHLTVTFIGGFMGCYAIFNRCDVFGSASDRKPDLIRYGSHGHSDCHMFFRFFSIADLHFLRWLRSVFLSSQAAEDHSEIRQSSD